MISTEHVRLMARYNRWQNASIYTAADAIGDEARRLDRGAFFGSIHGTLSHLLWGDMMWLHRFTGRPRPSGGISSSRDLFADWGALQVARESLDAEISSWAASLDTEWLKRSITWASAALNRDVTRANWTLAAHFFNHQTHHRGQVHAMLTAAGAKPDDTDLMVIAGD
jgi:uncharacterized damage-inducible protein DinB